MNSTSKSDATIKGIKDLGGEVSAWEGRLLNIQSQVNSLNGQRDNLSKEIEEKKALHNQAVEKAQVDLRQERQRLSDERDALNAKRAEFDKEVIEFRKERVGFEKEKDFVVNLKRDTELQLEKVGNFIRNVKDQAAKF